MVPLIIYSITLFAFFVIHKGQIFKISFRKKIFNLEFANQSVKVSSITQTIFSNKFFLQLTNLNYNITYFFIIKSRFDIF